MNQREPRVTTLIPARLRTDDGWKDATIRNVSSRGAMLQLSEPAPRRGTYVELRRATSVMVGRIIWSTSDRCGITTRERIDLDALRDAGQRTDPTRGEDRRHLARAADAHRTDSGILKRYVERLALICAVAVATVLLGSIVYRTLSTPANAAIRALDSSPPPLPPPPLPPPGD